MLRGGVVWTVDGESAVAKYGSVGSPRLSHRAGGSVECKHAPSRQRHASSFGRLVWLWMAACTVHVRDVGGCGKLHVEWRPRRAPRCVTLGGPIYDGSDARHGQLHKHAVNRSVRRRNATRVREEIAEGTVTEMKHAKIHFQTFLVAQHLQFKEGSTNECRIRFGCVKYRPRVRDPAPRSYAHPTFQAWARS